MVVFKPKMDLSSVLVLLCALIPNGLALWCYQCVSTQPGCGTSLNWLFHWTKVCPEDNDVCVKIIEEREGETVITRDCLSSMRGVRVDIPADHYEGCRPAAEDLKLANYVNNSIKELDIYRNYYTNTTWCFCFLDQRCNDAQGISVSVLLILSSICLTLYHMVGR